MFTPKFKNLVELYRSAVETFANNELFGVKKDGQWVWMRYGEFGRQVDRARAGLHALSVHKGDRVAVIANNRPEWAIGAYATYTLGAAYVPMYEAQNDKEWQYILKDSGAKVCIVSTTAIADRLEKLRGELPVLAHLVVMDGAANGRALTWNALLEKGKDPSVPLATPDGQDVAGFIYTSGTTGNPKGVLLSHSNLASNVCAIEEVFPLDHTERSLSFLPWAHSFGQVAELHALIARGASLALAESVDKIVPNLAEVRPTLLFSVPRIFNKIYEGVHRTVAEVGGLKKKLFDAALRNANRRRALAARGERSGWMDLKHRILDKLVFSKIRARFGGQLKYAISGGAALSRDVAEFVDNLGIMVYEGYGLTETSPIATANCPGARKIGSVGKAIPGVRIEIDPSASGDDKQGEIIVHGHNIMLGYHGLPEENAKVFTKDRGFRTGDMGTLDADGYLTITGRIKEQYKLENGKYVVPVPLEEQLKLSPFITNAMVYGDNKPFNVALIVPEMAILKRWADEQGIDASDPKKLLGDARVRTLIEQEVEKQSGEFKQFEKIKRFSLVPDDFTTDNDMLTPTMKLKRRVVMNRFGGEIQSLYA